MYTGKQPTVGLFYIFEVKFTFQLTSFHVDYKMMETILACTTNVL